MTSEYIKKHHVQIMKIDNEGFSLIRNGAIQKGNYLIARIGAFSKELSFSGVKILAQGICDACELNKAYEVIDEKQAKNCVKSIQNRMSKDSVHKNRIQELEEEVRQLKSSKEIKKASN